MYQRLSEFNLYLNRIITDAIRLEQTTHYPGNFSEAWPWSAEKIADALSSEEGAGDESRTMLETDVRATIMLPCPLNLSD